MESDDDASEMEPLLDEESGSWADRGDEEDRGTTSGGEDDELLTSEESSRSEGGSVSEGAEADPEHGSTGTPTHDLFASDFSILTEAAIVTVQGTPLALCSLLMVFSSWVDLAVVARLGITELSAAGLVHAIQVIGMTGICATLRALEAVGGRAAEWGDHATSTRWFRLALLSCAVFGAPLAAGALVLCEHVLEVLVPSCAPAATAAAKCLLPLPGSQGQQELDPMCICRLAGSFARMSVVSAWPLALGACARAHLLSQGEAGRVFLSCVVSLVLSTALHVLLVFGIAPLTEDGQGWHGLGLLGAPIATLAVALCDLAALSLMLISRHRALLAASRGRALRAPTLPQGATGAFFAEIAREAVEVACGTWPASALLLAIASRAPERDAGGPVARGGSEQLPLQLALLAAFQALSAGLSGPEAATQQRVRAGLASMWGAEPARATMVGSLVATATLAFAGALAAPFLSLCAATALGLAVDPFSSTSNTPRLSLVPLEEAACALGATVIATAAFRTVAAALRGAGGQFATPLPGIAGVGSWLLAVPLGIALGVAPAVSLLRIWIATLIAEGFKATSAVLVALSTNWEAAAREPDARGGGARAPGGEDIFDSRRRARVAARAAAARATAARSAPRRSAATDGSEEGGGELGPTSAERNSTGR